MSSNIIISNYMQTSYQEECGTSVAIGLRGASKRVTTLKNIQLNGP